MRTKLGPALSAALSLPLILLIASACGSDSADEPEDERVQLVYQDWRTEYFPPMAQEMLDRFHETNPNIRVFYTPDPDDVEQTMASDMQAGVAPDVFQGCCSHFPGWA